MIMFNLIISKQCLKTFITRKYLLENLEAITENMSERICTLRPKLEELSNKIEVFCRYYIEISFTI